MVRVGSGSRIMDQDQDQGTGDVRVPLLQLGEGDSHRLGAADGSRDHPRMHVAEDVDF
jgi:hypothetical protein